MLNKKYPIGTLIRFEPTFGCALPDKGKVGKVVGITEGDVRMIVHIYRTGLITQQKIADIYHVTDSLISGIVNKKSWKHVWSK